MDLFSTPIDSSHNWLPKDGVVEYHGTIFSKKESTNYYEALLMRLHGRQIRPSCLEN